MITHRVYMYGVLTFFFISGLVAFSNVGEAQNVERSERREPFKPLIGIDIQRIPIFHEADTTKPLTRFELQQFKITGIILGEFGDYATLLAPDGKTYMITEGVSLGKFAGNVVSISDNTVLVRELRKFQVGKEIITEEKDVPLYLNPLQNITLQPASRFVVLGK